MENMAPAFVAFTAAVLVGFCSHFAAEDYRRFRDGQAIAAALAGELSSIMMSLPGLRPNLVQMKAMLDRQLGINLPEMADQSSPIFEKNAEKVGLLGVELACEVAFVYDQIRAFRTSFQLLSRHHSTMKPIWCSNLVGSCIELIERNEPRAQLLIEKLRTYSDSSYAKSEPVSTALILGVTIFSLSSLLGAVFCVVTAS